MNKIKVKNIIRSIILLVLATVIAFTVPANDVQADTYDDQIKALQNEIAGYQNDAANLRSQADSLANEISALQAERNALQAQINESQKCIEQLTREIAETEQRIENQRTALASVVRDSYLNDSISPLEILASSDSISDYVDKQEYRNKIQEDIKNTLASVKTLREDLAAQKLAAEQTLADQDAQRGALVAKESEQNRLLSDTQGKEAAYQEISKQKEAEVKALRAAQLAAMQAVTGGNVVMGPNCGGGYSGPWNWCNLPKDATVDRWGMYTRECVSYTAFKVWASGRYMPYWGGHGNANQWDGNARAMGIPVSTEPQEGDVAMWPVGYYGHVMYVEAVLNDGSIYISEYNYDWTGRYSERSISRSTYRAQGFQFIHFQ